MQIDLLRSTMNFITVLLLTGLIKALIVSGQEFDRLLNPPTVQTSRGSLKGKLLATSVPGNVVVGYFGIPYARAERFKKPTTISNWTGERDATKLNASCPQDHKVLANNLIVRKPVVIVTINYRLGPLGFMVSYMNGEIQKEYTNLGILDQMEALRWVQREISSFGGDARRVTVYGTGAGSISASMLTLMSDADGLFGQVFLQSNSFVTPVYHLREGYLVGGALRSSKHVIESVGCELQEDPLECMRTKTVDELLEAALPTTTPFEKPVAHEVKDNVYEQVLYGTRWHPIEDKDWFEIAKRLAARPKRPMMIGLNRDEWSFFMLKRLSRGQQGKRDDFIRILYLLVSAYNCESHLKNFRKLYRDYVKDVNKNLSTQANWLKLENDAATDGYNAAALWLDADASCKAGSPTYLFEIEHVAPLFPNLANWQQWVPQTFDFELLLGEPGKHLLLTYNATERDKKAAAQYSQMLINFVAAGLVFKFPKKLSNPTPDNGNERPKWEPLNCDDATKHVSANYYSIQENPEMKNNFRPNVVEYWAPWMRCL